MSLGKANQPINLLLTIRRYATSMSTLVFSCLISAIVTGWAVAMLVWLGEIPDEPARQQTTSRRPGRRNPGVLDLAVSIPSVIWRRRARVPRVGARHSILLGSSSNTLDRQTKL